MSFTSVAVVFGCITLALAVAIIPFISRVCIASRRGAVIMIIIWLLLVAASITYEYWYFATIPYVDGVIKIVLFVEWIAVFIGIFAMADLVNELY
ncbi:hypothetical protein FWF48_03415 [Candidatus Saccharibacteria bacterium]|nr:hypothetical protein [Candidatus Saccharibacteria bacterium]